MMTHVRRNHIHCYFTRYLGLMFALSLLAGFAVQAAPTAQTEAAAVVQLVKNGEFTKDLGPWWTTASVKATVANGELCAVISNGGAKPWDAIVGQHGIHVVEGQTYTATFDARADRDFQPQVKCQEEGGDYTGYLMVEPALTMTMQTFSYSFTAPVTDRAASFQFQMGANGEATVCIDNVSVTGAAPVEAEKTDAAAARPKTLIQVNQTGYFPDGPKVATIATDATTSVAWELADTAGNVVTSGKTTVFGNDAASGDHVHLADFSAYTTVDTGYTLNVGGESSAPFDIRSDLYASLKYQALAYFYHNRSGIEIAMPYAGENQWVRPAGHMPEKVTCFNQKDTEGKAWQGCDYTLDVTGGWYDAGDHGKYVVNGGISAWTLLNEYERAQFIAGAKAASLADGTLNIPENKNGIPDILDEVRWEIEFMLKIQVPPGGKVEGKLLEGMVHHKLADAAWTGLGVAPHEDPQPRFLYPPSTAATLNMAAVAAQAARIWKTLDPAFADTCLKAAEIAWKAALANPAEFARGNFTGSGPYDDTNVTDEFYWAAAELFITTGKAEYQEYLLKLPLFTKIPVTGGTSMTWQSTAALGTISLAIAPNNLSQDARDACRKSVIAAADQYVAMLDKEGYRFPFTSAKYPWGSNSNVLNNAIILALAYDFTGDATYLDAVTLAMDYLLGRNAMGQSYVSAYGENSLKYPHHRFWAGQKHNGYPLVPPGAVSGGPNASIQDPVAQGQLNGCVSQKCYIDDLDSWSTNEICINWNAPLAWVVNFLDEQWQR